jgi:hypothetical protein
MSESRREHDPALGTLHLLRTDPLDFSFDPNSAAQVKIAIKLVGVKKKRQVSKKQMATLRLPTWSGAKLDQN